MIKIYDLGNATHIEMSGDAKTCLSELYYFKKHELEIILEVTRDIENMLKDTKGTKHEHNRYK